MKKFFSIEVYICLSFLLLSFSAIGFSEDNAIVIQSDADHNCTLNNSYGAAREKVLNFENYHMLDDNITWQSLGGFMPRVRLLDMTVSEEYPKSVSTSHTGEIKRSEVWVVFSPAGLDRSYKDYYPKIPLVCSASESQGEGGNQLTHQCELITTGTDLPTYAVTSFTSHLRIVENPCGPETLGASFEVRLSADSEHVDEIYEAVIDFYELDILPGVSILFNSVLDLRFQQEIFSGYFKDFYRQFLEPHLL